MDRELTRAELDELLPLYALDALDGEEQEQVARYVARDDAARAEVGSLREAASYLPQADLRAPAQVAARLRALGYEPVWEDWAVPSPATEAMLAGLPKTHP